MSNKNDVVILELDRPREIRYGYKAIKTLLALIGKDLEELDTSNMDEVEKVIYAGILSDAQRNGETLKLEDMEDLLDLKPFDYVVEQMNKALNIAFGGNTEKNAQRIAQKKN